MVSKFSEVFDLASKDYEFKLNNEQSSNIIKSHEKLIRISAISDSPIYGLSTYYGADVVRSWDKENWRELQLELLNYLKVGVGPSIPKNIVRRALRLQAIKVGRGCSGTHPITVEKLVQLSNSSTLPEVPCYGSLGASGDLIPMAHAVSPIFETEEVHGPRDVISLVNTNSMMSSIAVNLLHEARSVIMNTVKTSAFTALALGTPVASFKSGAPKANLEVLSTIRAANEIARVMEAFGPCKVDERPVQDRYSLRCSPQVLGTIFRQLEFAESHVLSDALAVADNPVIVEDEVCHGGLFFTSELAAAADLLKDAISKACEMINRQCFLLVDPAQSFGLPRNLDIGNRDNIKGVHQLINSLEQAIRCHGLPTRMICSPAEGYNQDIVPGSMVSLLNTSELLDKAKLLVRAGLFISERASYLRMGESIPKRLQLSSWQNSESTSETS